MDYIVVAQDRQGKLSPSWPMPKAAAERHLRYQRARQLKSRFYLVKDTPQALVELRKRLAARVVRVLAFWTGEEPFAPDEAFEAIKEAFGLGQMPASVRRNRKLQHGVSFVGHSDPAEPNSPTTQAIVIWEANGRPTKEQLKQATEDYLREVDKKRARR